MGILYYTDLVSCFCFILVTLNFQCKIFEGTPYIIFKFTGLEVQVILCVLYVCMVCKIVRILIMYSGRLSIFSIDNPSDVYFVGFFLVMTIIYNYLVKKAEVVRIQ